MEYQIIILIQSVLIFIIIGLQMKLNNSHKKVLEINNELIEFQQEGLNSRDQLIGVLDKRIERLSIARNSELSELESKLHSLVIENKKLKTQLAFFKDAPDIGTGE